jgi:(p)ppGpp synthase/HD superfamily hydrolase
MYEMDYSIEDAIGVASEAHDGQVDKSGQPYIFHPIRVMLNCQTKDQQVVGVLHDVLEDTIWGTDELELFFPKHIVEAVEAITKQEGESNEEYILRCRENEIAREVKISDICDNLSPIRQMNLDIKTQERLRKKYTRALELILDK